MAQLADYNHEEMDSTFTRPTLDHYLCNKYWGFITGGDLSQEEVADLENAKSELAKYEKLYALMEYGSDLNGILTAIDCRIASNNPSILFTLYRQVRISNHSSYNSRRTTRRRRFSRRWSAASTRTTA